jgi:hypothetical protein
MTNEPEIDSKIDLDQIREIHNINFYQPRSTKGKQTALIHSPSSPNKENLLLCDEHSYNREMHNSHFQVNEKEYYT